MTTYVMQAKENYDPTRAAQANGAGFPTATVTAQSDIGTCFDPARREISYCATIAGVDDSDTLVPLYIVRKNIDTGTVVFNNTFSPDFTVDAGVEDGWTTNDTFPTLNDPRSGDVWVNFSFNQIYVFRRADDYALGIGSYAQLHALAVDELWATALTDDYAYVVAWGAELDVPVMNLIPRENTSAEITAGHKIPDNSYDFPEWFGFTNGGPYFVTALDNDGDLWIFGTPQTDAVDFRLWKFAVADGSFTDETPWISTTGPNAPGVGATLINTNQGGRVFAAFNPGRTHLNLVSSIYSGDFGGAEDANNVVTVTTYAIADGTWTSFTLAENYMTAAWVPTGDPAAAAYLIDGALSWTNAYLDMDNSHADGGYADRWAFFNVFDVVAGTPNYADSRRVLVKFTWNGAGAPTVAAVIDEQNWDDAYTAFGTAISNPRVVSASMLRAPLTNFNAGAVSFFGFDNGIYDPTGDAFWWGGVSTQSGTWADQPMFQLDPAFAGRAANNANPPLLKLFAQAPAPPSGRRPTKVSVDIRRTADGNSPP